MLTLRESVAIGQISGAMGTYANTNPKVEQITCDLLGLKPDTASTQVISRDRHAEYVQTTVSYTHLTLPTILPV